MLHCGGRGGIPGWLNVIILCIVCHKTFTKTDAPFIHHKLLLWITFWFGQIIKYNIYRMFCFEHEFKVCFVFAWWDLIVKYNWKLLIVCLPYLSYLSFYYSNLPNTHQLFSSCAFEKCTQSTLIILLSYFISSQLYKNLQHIQLFFIFLKISTLYYFILETKVKFSHIFL